MKKLTVKTLHEIDDQHTPRRSVASSVNSQFMVKELDRARKTGFPEFATLIVPEEGQTKAQMKVQLD